MVRNPQSLNSDQVGGAVALDPATQLHHQEPLTVIEEVAQDPVTILHQEATQLHQEQATILHHQDHIRDTLHLLHTEPHLIKMTKIEITPT